MKDIKNTEQKDFYIDFSKNKEVEKKYNELLFFMKKRLIDALNTEVQ